MKSQRAAQSSRSSRQGWGKWAVTVGEAATKPAGDGEAEQEWEGEVSGNLCTFFSVLCEPKTSQKHTFLNKEVSQQAKKNCWSRKQFSCLCVGQG